MGGVTYDFGPFGEGNWRNCALSVQLQLQLHHGPASYIRDTSVGTGGNTLRTHQCVLSCLLKTAHIGSDYADIRVKLMMF